MKRRRTVLENEEIIFKREGINIVNIGGQIIFEIKEHITLDLAEAISLAMNEDFEESEFWSLPVQIFDKTIISEKALYWLSGGDKEWVTLENYSDSWYNCYSDFCSKWEPAIIDIISKSETLLDIKLGYKKRLNLVTLYDWAISKGFVK